MQSIELIQRKLFLLRNYEAVFRGGTVRQTIPICCGQELGLGELLKTAVNTSDVKIDGNSYIMFEATCPVCGQKIPPQWEVKA